MTAPFIENQLMRPGPDLGHLIEFFWYLKIPGNYPLAGEVFIPDGHIVLALNLAGPLDITAFLTTGPVKQRFRSVLVGQYTRGLRVEKNGELELLCIYLKSEFLHHYCKVAVSAFADAPLLPPGDVFGKTIEVLEERGRAGKTLPEKVGLVEDAFRKYFRVQFYSDASFVAARQMILNSGGQLPIERISREVALPYKTLQRRFNSLLGLSPKSFARTVRFFKVYQQLVTGQGDDLLGLAIAHGYYDQNHFSKEFRHFTHHTPTQWDTFWDPRIHQNARHWDMWN